MDYPSNSLSGKDEAPKVRRPVPTGGEVPSPVTEGEKQITKIVTGKTAIRRKKSMWERMIGSFTDQGKGIVQSIVEDILKPAIKDTISDALINGVERAVHGEARTTRPSRRGGPVGGHVPYNRYSTTSRFSDRPEPRDISARGRSAHLFDEIELPTRAQAQATLQQMDQIIKRFNTVSVSDLYEMLDMPSEFTDEKWGWFDLSGSDVRRTRSGNYALILPPTEAL